MKTQTTRIKCLDKFKPLVTKRKRVKILVGGRASTKSTFVADYVSACLSKGQLWCAGREYQNSIDESVHRLLLDEIQRLDLNGFQETKTDLKHSSGGRVFYRGLARNVLSLKGILSGVDGLWIEEGEGLSDDTLRVMTGSVRTTAKDFDLAKKAGLPVDKMRQPEIWITMNRGSITDPISIKYLERAEPELERCGYYEDDALMIVEANYPDVPKSWFLGSGLETERADDERMMTKAQYKHKWHGGYLETVEDAIIQEEWVEACIDAHTKMGWEAKGVDIVCHDPADTGDAKGLIHRKGSVIVEAIEKKDGDVNEACDWACDYAIEVRADEFIYDAGGLGNSLKRQIGDSLKGKKITINAFNGASEVDDPKHIYEPLNQEISKPRSNKETFRNRRAQRYINLRDRIYNTFRAIEDKTYPDPDTLLSISSKCKDLRQLKTELCKIPRVPNGQGMMQIMSKDQMKTKGIPSPNLADPAMMAMDGGKDEYIPIKLKQVGWG